MLAAQRREMNARAARVSVAIIATVAACYSPDVRDCSITCEATADCASGQICGAAHLCAAPAVASECARSATQDAGAADSALVDARQTDAAARSDAAVSPDAAVPTVLLHLHDDGMGEITTSSGATCDAQGSQHGDCMISVPQGVTLTLVASGEAPQVFQQWTGQGCSGTVATCTYTPTVPTSDIHAKFGKASGGGDLR